MAARAPHRIDVHHHLFPPVYQDRLVKMGHYLSRGVARGWTPRVSLDDMDQGGIAKAMVSITAPGLDILAPDALAAVTRECNDYAARMKADHPARFGFFAALPLPDVDASLKEIAYVMDVLKADGVGFMTSYENRWLGDAAFAPVMEELHRRGAVAYVHPTAPDCCRNLMPGVADWVLEFPVDTTRTIASLLFSGTLARCPGIRFIFAHLGGVLPLLADHLLRAAEVDPQLAARVGGSVQDKLRTFHFDTALRGRRGQLQAALEVIGVPQMLLGTDAPLRRSIDQLQGLLDYGFSPTQLGAIERDNALRLFSR